mmetsp:Transcript_42211/g.89769  ORF Transcript_42211/g.89769 Transcript_42211/m.89769 type:complete len:286 (-) Transcript_42211:98-955(-)
MYSLRPKPPQQQPNLPCNFLRNPARLAHQRRKFLIVMTALRRGQFDQIKINVQQVQRRRVNLRRLLVVRLRILQDPPFEEVHLLEEFLRRLHRGEVVRRLLLVDAEGVPEEVHGGFHVVVPRVEDVGGPAVPVLFVAHAVDVLLLPGYHDRFGHVEKVLDRRVRQIAPDDRGRHQQEFVHRLLHPSVIPTLGYRDGGVLPRGGASGRAGRVRRQDHRGRGGRRGGAREEAPPLERRRGRRRDLVVRVSRGRPGRCRRGAPRGRRRWLRRKSVGACDGCQEQGQGA